MTLTDRNDRYEAALRLERGEDIPATPGEAALECYLAHRAGDPRAGEALKRLSEELEGLAGLCRAALEPDGQELERQLEDRAVLAFRRGNWKQLLNLVSWDVDMSMDVLSVLLARCREEGLGVPRDVEKARRLYEFVAGREGPSARRARALRLVWQEKWEECVPLLQEAADQGRLWAAYQLGRCSELGNGLKQNYRKAIILYNKAAEAGDEEAAYYLGCCHLSGRGIEQDSEWAIEWFTRSARGGCKMAWEELGSLSRMAELRGDSRLLTWLGNAYDRLGRPAQALSCWKRAADSGYTGGVLAYARCLLEGKHIEDDPDRAMTMLAWCADRGDPDVMYELGRCYEEGLGTASDLCRALFLYRAGSTKVCTAAMERLRDRVALQLNALWKGDGYDLEELLNRPWTAETAAQMRNLALTYPDPAPNVRYGFREEERDNRVRDMLERAAELGDIPARIRLLQRVPLWDMEEEEQIEALRQTAAPWLLYWLGARYEREDGLIRKALELYNDSANGDDAMGRSALERHSGLLEVLEQEQQGTVDVPRVLALAEEYEPSDMRISVELYRIAAARGDPDGLCYLGQHLLFGVAVQEDRPAAQRCFLAAAEQDHWMSFYWLGQCFEYGCDAPADPERALYWYRRGLARGDEDCGYCVTKMETLLKRKQNP